MFYKKTAKKQFFENVITTLLVRNNLSLLIPSHDTKRKGSGLDVMRALLLCTKILRANPYVSVADGSLVLTW